MNNHLETCYDGIPLVGICGYSNSGKTTLIEKLVTRYALKGLYVAVIKQYSKRFQIDQKGKDTDRLFHAGATVCGLDSEQHFFRTKIGDTNSSGSLHSAILKLADSHDLVLVEGRKHLDIPVKIWLRRNTEDAPPFEIRSVASDLEILPNRSELAGAVVDREIEHQFRKRTLYCGIFTGCKSFDRDYSKEIGVINRITGNIPPCVNKIFLLGNAYECIEYSDFERITWINHGNRMKNFVLPILRAFPNSSWLFIKPSDTGLFHSYLETMLLTREPGIWSIFPQLHSTSEMPEIFWVDSRAATLLDDHDDFTCLKRHSKTVVLSD
jgi:molybdopterin-guanine dinucleotide biosynthesis protein MobB